MDNQFNSGSQAQGNMAPNQPDPFGYNNQRSQQPVAGRPSTGNSRQPTSMPQQFDAASWGNPMSAAQSYGNAQYTSQNASYNTGFYMPNSQQISMSQQTPGYPLTDSIQQNFQAPFNPADATLQQWAMATTRQNNDYVPNMPDNSWGSNVQYSGQRYPGQQTEIPQTRSQRSLMSQTQFQQAPVRQASLQQTFVQQSQFQLEDGDTHNLDTNTAAYNDYTGYDMDADPSAQLMAELNGASRSPSPQSGQLPEGFDSKDEDMTEDLASDSLQPADDWSNVLPKQPANSSEGGIFKKFEDELISSEAEKILQRQLGEEVDQVIDDLNDEDMQDIVSADQTVIRRTPEHAYITTFTDPDRDVDAEGDEYVEDSVSEDESEAAVDTLESGQMPEEVAENVDSEEEDTENDDVEHDPETEMADAQASETEARDSAIEGPALVEFEGYMLAETPTKTIKQKTMSKQDKELHQKATKLIPHHLPPSRYWTAVLHHTVQPNKARVEKDFIWMKGSRLNTVETIYNKYKEVTTEDRHRIFFCGEPPEFDDVLEELDVFDDKLVVFRAHVQTKVVIELD